MGRKTNFLKTNGSGRRPKRFCASPEKVDSSSESENVPSERHWRSEGFTLIELTVTMAIFALVAVSFFGLFSSLVSSTIVAKRQAVASTLATAQMEYLKSLPYDSLAIVGGAIYSASPLPATSAKTLNGVTYTIKTSINYVDDAYDGCGAYPTQAQKEFYCRNYPPPSGSPATDTNPKDYKIAHVSVTDKANTKLAEVDTEISARVSESLSSTGALFVSVIDNNGNKISGANVTVVDTTVTPNVNMADNTDVNGTAIFYDLPPDTNNYDFVVTAAKTGYSSLATIIPTALQPTYPNQKIFTQQSSFVTLTIKMQGANSLVLETTNTSGVALAGVKVYTKGGYKKYTATSDTAYYFDNMSPSDTRPTTDASGLASISNLVPGDYIFCGDTGATSCSLSGTTYYLAAAVPYGGDNPFNPVEVPTYDPASPPSTTFSYSGNNFLQKVRLMLTTSSTFPRITSLSPSDISLASGTVTNFPFTVKGVNLPCTTSAASCNTSVKFLQGSNTFTASCTGTSGGTSLSCTVNLTGAVQGIAKMQIAVGASTLTMPDPPLIGGLVVNP